jgi:hypothetical protein
MAESEGFQDDQWWLECQLEHYKANRDKIADMCGVAEETRVVDPITGGQKGQKLQMFSLIPPEFLWELAKHYGVGARKYDRKNWEKGYAWSLSLDASQRHLNQWLRGEDFDQETMTNHLICAIWHLIALYTFDWREIGTDDIRIEG